MHEVWLNVTENGETDGFDVLALWSEVGGFPCLIAVSVTPTAAKYPVLTEGEYNRAAEKVARAYNATLSPAAPVMGVIPRELIYATVL